MPRSQEAAEKTISSDPCMAHCYLDVQKATPHGIEHVPAMAALLQSNEIAAILLSRPNVGRI